MARLPAILHVLATLLAVAVADNSVTNTLTVSLGEGCFLINGAPACSKSGRPSVTVTANNNDNFVFFVGAKWFGNPSIQYDKPGCYNVIEVHNNGQWSQRVSLSPDNCFIDTGNARALDPPQCCNVTYEGDNKMLNPYWAVYQNA